MRRTPLPEGVEEVATRLSSQAASPMPDLPPPQTEDDVEMAIEDEQTPLESLPKTTSGMEVTGDQVAPPAEGMEGTEDQEPEAAVGVEGFTDDQDETNAVAVVAVEGEAIEEDDVGTDTPAEEVEEMDES